MGLLFWVISGSRRVCEVSRSMAAVGSSAEDTCEVLRGVYGYGSKGTQRILLVRGKLNQWSPRVFFLTQSRIGEVAVLVMTEPTY